MSDFPHPGGPSNSTPAPSNAAQLACICIGGTLPISRMRRKRNVVLLVGPECPCEASRMTIATEDIAAAATRIRDFVRRTPLLRLSAGELGVPIPLTLKLELLQHAGSFKPRGAFNFLLAAQATGT